MIIKTSHIHGVRTASSVRDAIGIISKEVTDFHNQWQRTAKKAKVPITQTAMRSK